MVSLKTRLKNRELTIGTWLTLGHTAIAEIMAKSGFDWVTVDMEHSAIGISEAYHLIQVIDLAGCVPLVRVGNNDATIIKRVMDTGAHGVIVPMVNSREDAERAVGAVKYPPHGYRGVGLARAQDYGVNFEGYKRWVETESIVIAQVEHIKAVENLEEILAVEGIDGIIVGPYDLSASLGIPGQFDHPEMTNALREIRRVSERLSAILGYHIVQPDVDQLTAKISEGYRFLAYSVDFLLLGNACRDGVQSIKKYIEGKSGG